MEDPLPTAQAVRTDAESLETFLVRLPKEMREEVRNRAAIEDRTQAQIVRRALRLYLQRPAD